MPNHDTCYFTLQALLSTECSADMIEQAASICQKMLLLLPHDGYSSSPQEEYIHLPRPHSYGCVYANVNSDDVKTMRQQLHHFVLKVIETSSQTKLTETPTQRFCLIILSTL